MPYKNDFPKYFSVEDVNTANYILKRCLTKPILKKTPYEHLKRKKLKISYFKKFGSKCFIHINGKENLKMLDTKSNEDISI